MVRGLGALVSGGARPYRAGLPSPAVQDPDRLYVPKPTPTGELCQALQLPQSGELQALVDTPRSKFLAELSPQERLDCLTVAARLPLHLVAPERRVDVLGRVVGLMATYRNAQATSDTTKNHGVFQVHETFRPPADPQFSVLDLTTEVVQTFEALTPAPNRTNFHTQLDAALDAVRVHCCLLDREPERLARFGRLLELTRSPWTALQVQQELEALPPEHTDAAEELFSRRLAGQRKGPPADHREAVDETALVSRQLDFVATAVGTLRPGQHLDELDPHLENAWNVIGGGRPAELFAAALEFGDTLAEGLQVLAEARKGSDLEPEQFAATFQLAASRRDQLTLPEALALREHLVELEERYPEATRAETMMTLCLEHRKPEEPLKETAERLYLSEHLTGEVAGLEKLRARGENFEQLQATLMALRLQGFTPEQALARLDQAPGPGIVHEEDSVWIGATQVGVRQ